MSQADKPGVDSEQAGSSQGATRRPRSVLGWAKLLAWLGISAALVALVVQTIQLIDQYNQTEQQAIATGQDQVKRIVDYFRRKALALEKQTQALARDLETGVIHPDNLQQRLKAESLKEAGILGCTVAFQPFSYDPKQRLFAPYYNSQTDRFVQCEDFYDYTDPDDNEDAIWYQAAAQSKTPQWVAAYGPAAESTYAGYSVPFFSGDPSDSDRPLKGVVNVAISLTALTDLLNTRFVGRLGAGIMVNREGVLLAFPNEDAVRAGRTWEEVLRAGARGEALYQLARDMAAGKSGRLRFSSYQGMANPQSGWFFYRPLEPSDWRLGVAIFENELYRNTGELNRRQIGIALTALAAVVLVPILLMKKGQFDLTQWLAIVTLFSVGGSGVIVYIWLLNVGQEDFIAEHDGPTVTDLQGLETFVDQQSEMAERQHTEPPKVIPTRVQIRNLEFDGAYRVKVSGHIWQTYTKGKHDGLNRGVVLADAAPDAEAIFLQQDVYEETQEQEFYRWSFRATLRNNFDYSNFPFDTQRVIVALSHPDQRKNVLLVPELASYRFLNTTTQPGVHPNLWTASWDTESSFFSYDIVPQTVESSLNRNSSPGSYPELQFNVIIHRQFLTPFISYIVPILIVTVLVYGVVVMSSPNQEKQAQSGFNVFGVLGTCGAFFFTIALMHIDLRERIDADVVTYLESLYFVSYALLVVVSMNALLFLTTKSIQLIEYRDNLLAKLLYWPIFTALMLAVTVSTFVFS